MELRFKSLVSPKGVFILFREPQLGFGSQVRLLGPWLGSDSSLLEVSRPLCSHIHSPHQAV